VFLYQFCPDHLLSVVQNLYQNFHQADRIALVGFNSRSKQMTPLCLTDYGSGKHLYETVKPLGDGDGHRMLGPGTNMIAGLEMALGILRRREQRNARCAIVLLGDGCNNPAASAEELARFKGGVAAELGCSVFALGIGKDHDAKFLRSIISKDGAYSYLTNEESMVESTCEFPVFWFF
jgi:hypothetical protein